MKTIAIISELALNNFNYGNRLQSYALNFYLNNNYKKYNSVSLIMKNSCKLKRTKINHQSILNFIKRFNKKSITSEIYDFSSRIENANRFTTKNINEYNELLDYEALKNTDYDIFIVGSDVVWAQFPRGVNRIKFLDFKTKKKFLKVSYAASFGRDYIPKENKKYLLKQLSQFDYISVREKSSIEMLNNLGINNVVHTCDPTLLLTKEHWEKVSKKVDIKEGYIFVYMLGKDKKQREEISTAAKKLGLKIATIPHADGVYNEVDNDFGDYKLDNCSPEEWLYLINNAEYIFTDSFHGIIFSTIFEKKFIALKRDYVQNINNRLIDYLDTIDESDKYMLVPNYNKLQNLNWDYKKINTKLKKFKSESERYLDSALI